MFSSRCNYTTDPFQRSAKKSDQPHALHQRTEPGIGPDTVEHRIYFQQHEQHISFAERPLVPFECLIFIT